MKTLFNSLKSRIIIVNTGVLIVSLVITTMFFSYKAKHELSESTEANALNLLEATKNHVESQYNSILYIKEVMLSRRKIELQNNVTLVFSMIRREHREYEAGKISEYTAKKRAIEAVRQAWYDDGVGYSWINDINRHNPKMVMHPFLQELTGHPMDDTIYNYGFGKEKNIGQAFINMCLENGEGFVEYLWPKPIPEGRSESQPKISFVKLFKPWDWIVGSGVYVDDIEKDVQNRINAVIEDLNKIISKQRIGVSGYYFIFNEEDSILVHPNLAGGSMNQLINPTTGNLLINELKKTALSPDHFMEYDWDKPGFEGEFRFPKKVFVTYYEPLGWYICSSVYKEDFEQKIINLKNNMLLFSISFLVLAVFISLLLSRSITNPLNILVKSIGTTNKDGLPVKNVSPTKIAEINLLGTTINNMINSIKKSGKELKVERDFSVELINTTPNIICGMNPKGITTFINPAGEKVMGFSKEEIIGKNWWELLNQNKEYKQAEKILETFVSKKTANFEIVLLNKNGEMRNVVWNSFTKRDNNNNILEIIGFGNDITVQKQIEKELIVAKERAEESNDLKSAFLANMSHEIRTPLNSILGFTEILKKPNLEKDEQLECIHFIQKGGKRLINIIDDIINISKIESGIIDIHLSEININDHFEFVYNSLKLNAENKKLKFSYNCLPAEKEAFINTDSEKLFGILTNLVKNAIKFTDKGTIEFGCAKKEQYLEFYVKDTGIGIPKEKQEYIFERFIQVDIFDKMAREGSGLGLAISKYYVEILGGSIWVVSEEGKGSTFFFNLPYSIDSKE
ncbi:MAG: cache domain-containing protein [Salinivirgaceae bacterium]|nr:cache domain-containing protein [Salinivirgaceae bacterium]